MASKSDHTIIKKYANRRLYNTGTSTYVTLEDLAEMVKKGEEFSVQDAKTGEDITHSVLTQIIFELENKDGQNMLPIPFLRQLIAFYGDQMQMIVPGYLEQTMAAFTREQERMREQLTSAFGKSPAELMRMDFPVKLIEEQVRRNTEMFSQAMRMFTPFPLGGSPNGKTEETTKNESEAARQQSSDDLRELKEQIAAMQRKIDQIAK
ncbi:polyhydroxyalkanoate biosynthesis repressor PhaR [Paramesorhizobium deserti]|uniref:Polyhydroxyalkanoate biosynthesis repressor PhaR n=1 Tax=Paramesorhizobium deserti TaxID=1494590 RepID=A0A135HSX0_9HYPH|nr:polyhydroxyalkanoate synthesis repressor PhaR [Paramesorhizobium deserti]KXF76291.1 polyhydroxyalkanoate biosynthesis repressor PhaR [Paramesorhizobium deserti]